jgi:hypothetical protein
MTRPRRPSPRWRLGLLAVMLASGAAACGGGTTRTTFPPVGSTPEPAGDATAATKQQVIAALAAAGLQAADAVRAYRPPEGALLAAAPRSVLQVALPDDPTHGYVVIYALASDADATAAATDHATYISSGPGAIQFPPGTEFVLRVAGSNVVFFSWSPDNAPDPGTVQIATTLSGIGTAIDIPG